MDSGLYKQKLTGLRISGFPYMKRSQSVNEVTFSSGSESQKAGKERESWVFLIVLLSASLYNHDIALTRLILFFLGILLLIT